MFRPRQMIPCIISLRIHICSALYNPCGSFYDEAPYVAGGEAAAVKPLRGGLAARSSPQHEFSLISTDGRADSQVIHD